jgi:hypothetical protein
MTESSMSQAKGGEMAEDESIDAITLNQEQMRA